MPILAKGDDIRSEKRPRRIIGSYVQQRSVNGLKLFRVSLRMQFYEG